MRAHQVLLLAIVAALAAPVLSRTVRQFNWGLLHPIELTMSTEAPFVHPETRTALGVPDSEQQTEFTPATASLSVPVAATSPAAVDSDARRVTGPAASRSDSSNAVWIAGSWAAMSALALLRLIVSFLRGRGLLAASIPLPDSAVTRAARGAADMLQIGAVPEILASAEIRCPVIWCWRRHPILLVPASLVTERRAIDWESLFCHELAHWKRKDHLSSLLAELAAVALPWQPLLWWSKRRLAYLADAVCDEWALQCGRSGPSYAHSLLDLLPQTRSIGAIPALRSRRTLEQRFRRILDPMQPRPLSGVWWTRSMTIGIAAATAILALLQTQINSPATAAQAAKTSAATPDSGIATHRETAAARQLVTDGFAFPFEAGLSPDGKFLAGSTWQSDLIVVDVGTGRRRAVAKCLISTPVVWSPDGQRIAFMVESKDSTRYGTELCIVTIASGKVESVLQNPPWMEDWSPDGSMMLGTTNKTGIPNQAVILVDLNSKKRIRLAEQTMNWTSARFSPDSKYVVYPIVEAGRSVLCLQPVDGSNPAKYSEFAGQMSSPIWLPDGSHIVFRGLFTGIDDRQEDLWAIPVREGKFVGTPFPVMANVSRFEFYNFSQTGQLAYASSFKQGGLYVLPVNPQTAEATGALRRLVLAESLWSTQVWSPDGSKIAFAVRDQMYLVSAKTGETLRQFSLSPMKRANGSTSWSPDGRLVLVPGLDAEHVGTSLFTLNVETGKIEFLHGDKCRSTSWSPDGKLIAYAREDNTIHVINVEQRTPRQITNGNQPHFSSDGRSIIHADATEKRLMVTSLDGKESREVFQFAEGDGINGLCVSPDGRYVAFTPGNRDIWVASLSAGAGAPRKLTSVPEDVATFAWCPRWSPDGTTISVGVNDGNRQYWVIENLLPKRKLASN